MLRNFLRRNLPDHNALKERWYLRPFKPFIQHPELLQIRRRSVCKGLAVGVFACFIPVVGQTVIATGGAILLRGNWPVAVAAAFISNPLTMAPMALSSYLTGTWLLGTPHEAFHFDPTLDWVAHELSKVWAPFLVGSVVLGIVSALLAYGISNFLWRIYVLRRYRRHRLKVRGARG